MIRPFALFAVLALALPAQAEEITVESYLDDRSSGASVIELLYNAINRMEYLRAWSYFARAYQAGEPTALQKDFEGFTRGYADTDSVRLLLGEESSEGAAGSTYYTVPAAIEATHTDGRVERFAGCYYLRLAQPSVQATPPFRPIVIEEGHLEPADGELAEILPESCPEL